MTNRAAFHHRPENLRSEVFFHPVETKSLWDKVWGEARKQDWWQDDLICVGNSDGYFYFQLPGLTTGYARLKVPLSN